MAIPSNMATAVPYANYDRWVADCPAECGNAWLVTRKDKTFRCHRDVVPGADPIGCETEFALDWSGLPASPKAEDAEAEQKRADEQAYVAEADREFLAQHTDDQGETNPDPAKPIDYEAQAAERGQADAE